MYTEITCEEKCNDESKRDGKNEKNEKRKCSLSDYPGSPAWSLAKYMAYWN